MWTTRRIMWDKSVLVLSLIVACHATEDPLDDFCRRFGHQTAVVDRRLYIDGGLVNWNPLAQNPDNFTNTGLLYSDLDQLSVQGGMPQLHDDLNKTSAVPSVEGGILWADDVNKIFYLFGGQYQNAPDRFSLWAYDTLFDKWTQPDNPAEQIERVSYGAGVAVNETGLAYYYGGWLSNLSVPAWDGQAMATSGLVQYDMVQDVWTNSTGPDGVGRAEGQMVYIPASDGGMLIYFGGISTPFGNESVVGEDMSNIYLYDIANAKWYNQSASGQVPEERRRFCAGVTWAEDQSSYNIYLYGGMGMAPDTIGFDDVYILSIPSFIWIKWYPTEPGTTSFPHHSLSCNIIDQSQMLIIGGTFENSTACDAPDVWGTHNLNLGKNDPTTSQWAFFEPNVTSYKVPMEIISAVGGTPTGGASLQTPSAGFSSHDLSVYFTRKATIAPRSPTRAIPGATGVSTSNDAESHIGAPVVIGACLGGAGLALLVALLLFCAQKRWRKGRNTPGLGIKGAIDAHARYGGNVGAGTRGAESKGEFKRCSSSAAVELPSPLSTTKDVTSLTTIATTTSSSTTPPPPVHCHPLLRQLQQQQRQQQGIYQTASPIYEANTGISPAHFQSQHLPGYYHPLPPANHQQLFYPPPPPFPPLQEIQPGTMQHAMPVPAYTPLSPQQQQQQQQQMMQWASTQSHGGSNNGSQ
ncbi:MAG: hypothetical protein M1838_003218 [Thelocarpon superellum]|nr:MAG: hypothetical protein M1838_003218 [Thelocarpon superellum]